MNNIHEPYIFKSLADNAERGKVPCGERDFARAYLRRTEYTDVYMPPRAIERGTVFHDLYMPYCVCKTEEECENEQE